jgi:hypothetical protein
MVIPTETVRDLAVNAHHQTDDVQAIIQALGGLPLDRASLQITLDALSPHILRFAQRIDFTKAALAIVVEENGGPPAAGAANG